MATTYSDGILITNVGKYRDSAGGTFGIVYLCRGVFDGVTKHFLVTLRPAISGIGTVKEWVFTKKSLVEAQKSAGNAVIAPGVLDLIEDWFPANDVMSNGYAGLKPDVLTNADTIFAATPPSTIPASGTIKGENITTTMVESILDLGVENSIYGLVPTEGGTSGTTTKLTANFKTNPTAAFTNTLTSPVQAFKDYPVQTALIMLGVAEVASRVLAGKPFVIPVGSKKKPILG